jgi:hypothetical protein
VKKDFYMAGNEFRLNTAHKHRIHMHKALNRIIFNL